jgi:hypothetical protein
VATGQFWRKGVTKVYFTTATISGVNEVQTLSISGTPTGGTFTLTFDGQTTATIAYNANAAAVQAALIALSNVGASDVVCTGGALPGTPVVITFGGALAHTDVALITAASGGLTGGSTPTASVALTTAGGPGPTQAQITAAEPLTSQINAMEGFETAVERIPTDDLDTTFVPTITGPRTVGDARITFLDKKNASGVTDADYDSIRTALADGTRGTLIIAPYGIATGERCELWPVESGGPNDVITLGNEPAKFAVAFGITGLPTKDAEVMA